MQDAEQFPSMRRQTRGRHLIRIGLTILVTAFFGAVGMISLLFYGKRTKS